MQKKIVKDKDMVFESESNRTDKEAIESNDMENEEEPRRQQSSKRRAKCKSRCSRRRQSQNVVLPEYEETIGWDL